jgi:hypothetical protein
MDENCNETVESPSVTGPVECSKDGCVQPARWVLVPARSEGVRRPYCSRCAADALAADPSLTLTPKIAA